MSITAREGWTVLHGILVGAAFLLTFAGGFAGLYSLRPDLRQRIPDVPDQMGNNG